MSYFYYPETVFDKIADAIREKYGIEEGETPSLPARVQALMTSDYKLTMEDAPKLIEYIEGGGVSSFVPMPASLLDLKGGTMS